MVQKRGLFINLEGLDGSGTGTQQQVISKHLVDKNKYLDVLLTHEPWRSEEIKRKLREDPDAYTDPLEMARLFVDGSRVPHSKEILGQLRKENFVVGDRYAMSTLAYQTAQGGSLNQLVGLHMDKGILTPDLTVLVDCPAEVCLKRIHGRGAPAEKFEKQDFLEATRRNYLSIAKGAGSDDDAGRLLGKVVVVDGSRKVAEVAKDVEAAVDEAYGVWERGEHGEIYVNDRSYADQLPLEFEETESTS